MGDGTQENPLTREDVLKAIEASGGPENTNLSEKWFEKGIDLRGLNNNHLQGITLDKARFPLNLRRDAPLRGANLKGVHLEGAHLLSTHLEEADLSDAYLERARLWHTHLERAYLAGAHLEDDANLRGAHLEGANLQGANLKGADLTGAHLEGAQLTDVRLSSDTKLHNVDWGNYILAEERHGPLDWAEDTYRTLKVWHTQAGIYDIAAKFYYREKEARRKALKWRSKSSFRHRPALEFVYRGWGYGEGWKRILFGWIPGLILLFALIYFGIGTLTPNTFLSSLYYSAVSFTALGYGSWVKDASGWVKGLGAFEALVGVSMMALLLVTFVRKWTR